MKISNFTRLGAAIILTVSSLLAINAPLVKAAGTNTWTGSSNDGQWSTAGNWSAGVPSTGDDLVFDNNSYGTGGVIDNISGLVVNSITFINNSSTPISIELQGNLGVTSSITQAASATTSINEISSVTGSHNIALLGDVTVTANGGVVLGTAGDTLALANHTLTFLSAAAATGNIVAVNANITSSGSVVYNSDKTDYQLYGNNTYSGTTHVIATSLGVGNPDSGNAFGSSVITVESGGIIDFAQDADVTINNQIIIAGTASGSPVTSVNFSTGSSSPVTITIPHITLNGNTRFGNNSADLLTVNLTGITANGHCIEYLGGDDDSADAQAAANFTGGPTSCIVNASVTTPDTGLAAVTAHPMTALAASAAAAFALLAVARRLKTVKR